MELINITTFQDQYWFLSNYYPAPVFYHGITYPSNEVAFQAQKTTDCELQKQFSSLSSGDARRFGRSIPLRHDWEKVKVSVMRDLIHEKFTQYPELSDRLCATGNVILIEGNTWNDKTWGMVQTSDGTWHGQNLLGQILMEERERQQELKQERSMYDSLSRK